MPLPLTKLLAAAALAAAASACTPGNPDDPKPSASSAAPPCTGNHASRTKLGDTPRDLAPKAAQFDTSGGALHITAYAFSHGGLFDPAKGRTSIYIGPVDRPPTYDAQRSTVAPLTLETAVDEDDWVTVELPAGRYWLLTSNAATIDLVSCNGTITGYPISPAGPPPTAPSPTS